MLQKKFIRLGTLNILLVILIFTNINCSHLLDEKPDEDKTVYELYLGDNTIIVDIEPIDLFASSKKFTSYLSSAPAVESSIEKTIVKRINKTGIKLSISLFCQSINYFQDNNPQLNKWYMLKSPYHERKEI